MNTNVSSAVAGARLLPTYCGSRSAFLARDRRRAGCAGAAADAIPTGSLRDRGLNEMPALRPLILTRRPNCDDFAISFSLTPESFAARRRMLAAYLDAGFTNLAESTVGLSSTFSTYVVLLSAGLTPTTRTMYGTFTPLTSR
jgi:hypothetical protein